MVDRKKVLREGGLCPPRAAHIGRGEAMISCQICVDFVLPGSCLGSFLVLLNTLIVTASRKITRILLPLQPCPTQNLVSNLSLFSSEDVFYKVPGSAVIVRYVKSSHQNDPGRTVLELILFFFAVGTLLQSRTRADTSGKNFVKYTEEVSLVALYTGIVI